MPSCIGMLGNSEHTIKVFASSLAKEGVEMLVKEFLTVEDIIDALTYDIDAVFVTDRACGGYEGGREEVLTKLRAADKTIRIIFCCESDQRDEGFENWCQYQRIGDIFYPEKSDDGKLSISIKPMAKAVKKGRLEPIDGDGEPQNIHQQPKANNTNSFFKGAGALVEKLGDTLQKSKPRVIEKIVEKEKIVYRDRDNSTYANGIAEDTYVPEAAGTVVVGVYNICRGAGATTMAVEIAKESGKRGTRVYVIAADGSDDLEYARIKHKNVRMSTHPDIEASLLDAMCCGAQLVILDFGMFLEVDRHGNIITSLAENRFVMDKLSTCRLRIAMCLSASWHLSKLTPYINGQNPKIQPSHLIFDEHVSGIAFPDVYTRAQMPYATIVNDIGVNKKSKRGFMK